jgi:hypothetical protein
LLTILSDSSRFDVELDAREWETAVSGFGVGANDGADHAPLNHISVCTETLCQFDVMPTSLGDFPDVRGDKYRCAL